MLTSTCTVASDTHVSLSDYQRELIHQRCLGGYRTPDGSIEFCDCECHRENPMSKEDLAWRRLPVLQPPPTPEPEPAAKATKKTAKGAATGSCEHCGAPTGGRFAPGHDAKLKSELTRAAANLDTEACAELILRDWLRLVKPGAIREYVARAAGGIAATRGYTLVEERNAARRGRYGDS